jgi:hypothetical protein
LSAASGTGRRPLGRGLAARLEELRRAGWLVVGPGPASPTFTVPVDGVADRDPAAGMRCLIAREGRCVSGSGGTADEAVRDALAKLAPRRVERWVLGPLHGPRRR